MAASKTTAPPTQHQRATRSATRGSPASTSTTTSRRCPASITTVYPSPPPSSTSSTTTTTPPPSSSSPEPTPGIKVIFNLATGKASQIEVHSTTGKRTTKWIRAFAPPHQPRPQCQPKSQPKKPSNDPLAPKTTSISKRTTTYAQIRERRRCETIKLGQLTEIARLKAQMEEMQGQMEKKKTQL